MDASHLSDISSDPLTLSGRLFSHATRNPDHDAVVTPELRLSYLELSKLVKAQVAILNNAGIDEHSIISIRCSNQVQHLVLCVAASYIGCTSYTIPTYETKDIQDTTINHSGTATIVDETLSVDLRNFNPGSVSLPESPGSARLLFSTSGTTGAAKLVVHHDEDIVAQAHRHIGSENERFLCLASIEHNFSKRHRLYCVAMGATNVFLESDQQEVVKQCQDLDVNVIHVSAFQARELLISPNAAALSGVRLKLGGSHVDSALRQKLRQRVTQTLQAGYGTTETGAIAFTDPNDHEAGESVGRPLPGIKVRTVTFEKKPLERGEKGEIAIQCKGMFREYLGNPELTASRLQNGWFHTGDIGYIDDQNRIHVSGRSDDMFVFNSINIYPQEIEAQIREHPSIVDAVVIPKSSSTHGCIPIALIVVEQNLKLKLDELKAFVEKKAGVRTPRQFIMVDEIPRNAVGKVVHTEVKALSEKSESVRENIIRILGEHVTRHLKPAMINALASGDSDIRMREFGLDSLARMNLLVGIEVGYDVVISPEELSRFRYFGNLVARVLSVLSDKNSPEQIYNPINPYVDTSTSECNRHRIVQLVRRVLRFSDTATQFSRTLSTLSQRITPLEIGMLAECHGVQQVIAAGEAEKYHRAFSAWLENIETMMSIREKHKKEAFVFRRLSPHVRYFVGPGSPEEKTLIVCFAAQGGRDMTIPSAVLLQHTDSSRFDLLMISEPRSRAYREGVPFLGTNMREIIEHIARLEIVKSYHSVRTFGCSVGGYLAILAGYRLRAELAVSVGARFHGIRKPLKFLERIGAIWLSARGGGCGCVLMTHAKKNKRDRHFANVISKFIAANSMAVEYKDAVVTHHILSSLAALKNLTPFLEKTIYADMDDALIKTKRAKAKLNVSDGEVTMKQ